jgi:glycosyltransferase involved in cell wall biosynthesis
MKRRIAFINYFCPHYRLGLFEELARRMEVDFYFFADERERYWNRKIPLVRHGAFRRVELRRLRVLGQAAMPGIMMTLTRSRYDAVVKCLNGRLMLPLVYFTCKLRGVPLVIWTGMWYHPRTSFHRLTRPLTEALYRRADAIVTYGTHVKQFVCEVDGVDPQKVFVAGQAVDPESFEVFTPKMDEDPEILFVGQFEERKGVFDLLDAFTTIEQSSVKLCLVGNGTMEEAIREHARTDSRVQIIGFVTQKELPARLARARCLVLPSITTDLDREPWGLVVNEAMHAGIPVIATDTVGAAAGGLVVDGRNGFVVPEHDPVALGRAIDRLARDREMALAMGRQAREDVRRFNYVTMADAFQSAVEYAIACHRDATGVASSDFPLETPATTPENA